MQNLLKRRVHAFVKDASGMGAVEFAFIAPVLLILYIGCVDVTRAVTFYWKMQHATAAVNDLVSQAEKLTESEIIKNFSAADKMLSPFRVGELDVTVTIVDVDENGVPTVDYSVTRGGPDHGQGEPFTLPDEMNSLRSVTLIVTETAYDYAPLMKNVLSTTIPMSAIARGRFRGRKEVLCSDCTS